MIQNDEKEIKINTVTSTTVNGQSDHEEITTDFTYSEQEEEYEGTDEPNPLWDWHRRLGNLSVGNRRHPVRIASIAMNKRDLNHKTNCIICA